MSSGNKRSRGSDSIDKKKQEERAFLERLVQVQPSVFNLPWKDGREPPDFEAATPAGLVALELVRYFHPCDMKAPRVGRERYIDEIRQKCLEGTARLRLPNARISFHITPERWPQPHDIESLSSSLLDFVSEKMPEPGKTVVFSSDVPSIAVHHGVRRVEICRRKSPGRAAAFWTFPQFGNLEELDLRVLQDLVDKHSRSLANYRPQFFQVWLVILGEASGLSSFAVKPDARFLGKIKSEFDRTFFFTLSSGVLVELPRPKNYKMKTRLALLPLS